MDANLIMKGPRAKIKRAHRHIDSLIAITSPLSPDFYVVEHDRRVVPPYTNLVADFLTYRPTQDIGEEIAVIVGDYLNNVRSALEYVASGISRAGAVQVGSFPIARKREDLITHRHLAAIEQALPGSKLLLLETIRPADGPNEAAWAFASINNDDKHNFLVPTVSITELTGLHWRGGGNTFTDMGVMFDATRPQVIVRSAAPITVENNFKATVEVRFGQGNPFENEPVVPTLLQVTEVVSEALDLFEGLIKCA